MGSRAIPPSFDAQVVGEIDQRLSLAESEHGIAIIHAAESGSRAWGFPSRDSDYDCRFIYRRPKSDYLCLWPGRDVIETALDPVFDINGWDLAKALRLIVKGNAVAIEWLTSPIVYRSDDALAQTLLNFARSYAPRSGIERHYLHLGRNQLDRHFEDGSGVSVKTMFYALRPALACQWLREHPDQAIVPMNLQTMLSECRVKGDLVQEIDRLVERKINQDEAEPITLVGPLVEFIYDELMVKEPGNSSHIDDAEARKAADLLFRSIIEQPLEAI